jgi:hypothetical protein
MTGSISRRISWLTIALPTGRGQNIGPLTSTFIPPTTCASIVYDSWVDRHLLYFMLCGDTHCSLGSYPTDLAYYPDFWPYYSPGYICPHGFTAALTMGPGKGSHTLIYHGRPGVVLS